MLSLSQQDSLNNQNASDASNSTSKYSDFRAIGNTNIRGRYGFQYSGNGSSYLGGKILIKDNHISNCYQSFSLSAENNLNDTIRVINNVVTRDHSITSWFDWNYLLFQEFDDVVFEGNVMDNTSSIYSRYIDSIVGNRFSNVTNRSAIYVQQGSPFIANNYIHTNGQLDSKGIYVDGQNLSSKDSMVIAHNSMEIMGTSGSSSRGLHIEADVTNMTVKNNIFSAKGGGLPVHVDVPLTNLDWDYNCYYTTGNNLANFNGTNYSTVSTLGAAMGSDANSLNLNPFYTSDTNLSINNSQLQVGDYLNNLPLDIDSSLRNNPPTIGAKEFSGCSEDAGITRIVSPVSPLSSTTQDIKVELTNHGSTTLTSTTIAWSVNNVLQPPFSWTGSLLTAESDTITIANNHNFSGYAIYNLNSWTEQPNSILDCNNLNDSSAIGNLVTPLCGVYTLGGVNPDFTSFNELNLALNNAGVTCPVTINVRDGVYDDQLLLSSVPGNSFVNTITIQGESGDSSLVRLEHSNTSTHIVFNVSDMKGLTLRDMTFDNNSGSGEANSFLVTDCDTVEISNCKFESFDSFSIYNYWTSNYLKIKDSRGCVIKNNNFSDASSVRVYSNSTSKYSDFRAIGNTNIRGRYGFQYSGNGSSYLGGKILIKDNHISNCYQSFSLSAENNLNDTIRVINNVVTRDHSITSWFDWNYLLFQEFDDVVFEGNVMDNTSSIYSRYIDSIVGNRFSNVTNRSAIYVQQGSPFIANNYIHTNGQLDSKGIYVDGQNLSSKDSMVIAHNSMEIMGTSGSSSRGLHIEADVTNMTVKNNIFSAKGGGLPVHVDVPLTNLDWDYNCYYTTGNNLANFNGTNYSTVSTLGAAMGSDANSLNLNPFYLSDTNLIVGQRELNGAGIAVPGVILDIDGDLRNLAAPDVGAQEFSADYGIVDLISPTLDCFHSDSEIVEIALRQYGDAPFTNLQVAYQLNNGPVTTQTINGTIYNDIQFSFSSTEDLSIYGTYQFKFWLVNNADENVNNDTLYRTIYRDDVPLANFTTNISCANETTDFFGTGSVTSGAITGYEWIFGDGDTSLLQNPTHVYDSSGSYDVILRVYSSIGCFGDTTKAINLNTTPNADFSYSNVCLGDSMSFISLTTVDTGLVNYNWSFGDGQISNDVNPVILYSDSGTYTTSLIASSSISGCQDTIVKNVRVNKSYNSSNYLSSMDTVVYFGIFYTNSDTVVYNFPTIDGCDSIVTTYISINASYDITLFDTICEGNSYNFKEDAPFIISIFSIVSIGIKLKSTSP